MATQWQLDGVIFDSETRHVMAQIKLPPDAPTEPAARDLAKLKELRIAIAVTWDRQQHYRVWRPYIVGANLNGFDYPVLERYMPNVRRRLGRKSIDLLTHARWGVVLGTLTSAMDELTIQYEGDPEPEESPSYLATLRQRVAFFGLTVDEAGGLLPSPSPWSDKFSYGSGVSLKNLAAVTLQQTKADKSASVPKLFAKGQLKQLITYCKRDVALTRDIFKYGVRHGCVHNASDNHLRVWWGELAAYLANHAAQQGASVPEADHFAWQLDRIKAQVARQVDPRLGLEPRQIPSIARTIIAAYNPFGVRMTAQERRASVDEDGESLAFS